MITRQHFQEPTGIQTIWKVFFLSIEIPESKVCVYNKKKNEFETELSKRRYVGPLGEKEAEFESEEGIFY